MIKNHINNYITNKNKKQGVIHLKKQGLMSGAIILMIANAISKILGAVFKIPLTYIVGEEGMAVYNAAFSIYVMFLSFVISGLPFAVSKMVSEYESQQMHYMSKYAVKKISLLLCLIGMAGSIILFFFADFFSLAMKEEKAVFAIRMIAPSLFFVAAGTSIRSYYQGISNMIPTAVSQVIESVIKLMAGYYLAIYFINQGVVYTSGGAVLGVTIGECAATAVFVIIYLFEKKCSRQPDIKQIRQMWNNLFAVALPLLFSSVIISMLSVVDTTVIRSGLINSGLDVDTARKIYGSYTGYALTVFHLPVGIIATLGVSILPVIAGSLAVNNIEKAKTASIIAIKSTIYFSIPCAVLIFFMSNEVLSILFNNAASANMLRMISPCLIMICLGNIITAIIQSTGKIMRTLVYTVIGIGIKIFLSIILMKNYGIYGAIIGSNISALIVMILNITGIKKIIGIKFHVVEIIIKPAAAAAVMCLMIYLTKKPLELLIVSQFARTIIICAAAASGYIMTLIITGEINFILPKSKNNAIIIGR